MMIKSNHQPARKDHNLTLLKSLFCTGSLSWMTTIAPLLGDTVALKSTCLVEE